MPHNPDEQSVLDYHRQNLFGGTGMKNADGSITTFKGTVVGLDDGYAILPTYWHGQVREVPDAVRFAMRSGIKFPRYKTLQDALSAERRLHSVMESDVSAANPKMKEPLPR